MKNPKINNNQNVKKKRADADLYHLNITKNIILEDGDGRTNKQDVFVCVRNLFILFSAYSSDLDLFTYYSTVVTQLSIFWHVIINQKVAL